MWEGLGGDGSSAADVVTQVLQDGGDETTRVMSIGNGQRLTSGLTQWSLADQATFVASLPSLAGADTVWGDMALTKGDASAGVGLEIFAGARTKAGWGSAAPGGPVTRQFGMIPVGNGLCSAVAIGTDRNGRAFDTLTLIAETIANHLEELPAGPCPS
jgi:hypothetical protein